MFDLIIECSGSMDDDDDDVYKKPYFNSTIQKALSTTCFPQWKANDEGDFSKTWLYKSHCHLSWRKTNPFRY